MHTLWRTIVRTVFWSYERGAWQYDLAVAAIVVFVLLSPRIWFRDQPQVGPSAASAQVALLREDAAGDSQTFRVDARLLASPIRTPELEHDIQVALRKSVPDLRGRKFQIMHIDPIRAQDGTVAYYDVSIKP